jgi:surface protein
MFSGCISLRELDISGFDSSSVENMTSMFSLCVSLEELICNDRAILSEYDYR